jgi:hypothetical protein
MTWRVSSILFVLSVLTFLLVDFRARLRAKGDRIPLWLLLSYVVTLAICVLLVLNVTGLVYDPYIGPYALGVTWLLAASVLIFVQNLGTWLQQKPERSDGAQ